MSKTKAKKKKKKLPCSLCTFVLTRGDKNEGDTCPWCNKGILTKPKFK